MATVKRDIVHSYTLIQPQLCMVSRWPQKLVEVRLSWICATHYFIVLLFNINVTSTCLHGVVLYRQALSMPVFTRLVMSVLRLNAPALLKPTQVMFIFFSFWNLDILRSVLPDICLNLTTLQALALDYLMALYPILLTVIS